MPDDATPPSNGDEIQRVRDRAGTHPIGITPTPGVYGYGIVNENVAVCAKFTSVGQAVVIEVDLDPVLEEQRIAVRVGHVTLGAIDGMDAQVVLRAGRLTGIPARVYIGHPKNRGEERWAAVTLAITIEADTIPRERVVESCARTPGAYAQHVQGCDRYTATLGRLCPDEVFCRRSAALHRAEGGFRVTIDGADIGTVLSRDAAYASERVPTPLEVDALIVKREGKRRRFAVHLAVELRRPGP